MGLLSKLFGRAQDPVRMLEDAIERLQIVIVANLVVDYSVRLKLQPPGDAALLANCVLSHATAMNPVGEAAAAYGRTHSDLIRDEALRLAAVADVVQAFSYLYAAITLLLAIRTRDPFSELAAALGARATELRLSIPNSYNICGSGDAVECIKAIAEFAADYKRRFRASLTDAS